MLLIEHQATTATTATTTLLQVHIHIPPLQSGQEIMPLSTAEPSTIITL